MDCGRLLAIAASAEELETDPLPKRKIADVRIGIARDAAFCFYYEDNLQLLREAGAELVPFSPLQDEGLPEGIAGLILGGGYPELHAKALSKNTPMRKAVHDAVAGGLPTIAECGGFLYLHETLCDDEGVCYPMAGVISASAKNTGKLVRFGYVMLTEKEENFLPAGAQIAGHEFHYYDSTDNGAGAVAKKPVTGRSWECVHESPSQWMGFPHLYYYSNPEYAYRFLKKAADRIYLKNKHAMVICF